MEHSAIRYVKRLCSEQNSIGNEFCIAGEVFIIAVDGIGSLDVHGFDNPKKFSTSMGLVLSGNGPILGKPDGFTIVSPAHNEHCFNDQISDVIM